MTECFWCWNWNLVEWEWILYSYIYKRRDKSAVQTIADDIEDNTLEVENRKEQK